MTDLLHSHIGRRGARALVCAALLAGSAGAALAHATAAAAAAAAQRETGGRVLSVDRADAGGRPVWRVKVVTPSGEVRVVVLDVSR